MISTRGYNIGDVIILRRDYYEVLLRDMINCDKDRGLV